MYAVIRYCTFICFFETSSLYGLFDLISLFAFINSLYVYFTLYVY